MFEGSLHHGLIVRPMGGFPRFGYVELLHGDLVQIVALLLIVFEESV